MNGSPSSVLTLGFGNGTFAGSPSLVVTLGYGVGGASATVTGPFRVTAAQGFVPGALAAQGFTPGATSAQGI